jgi:hypothetical protein
MTTMSVQLRSIPDRQAADKGADVNGVIRRAQDVSAVSNSIKRGVPVRIVAND